MKFILGKKIGMSTVYTKDKALPVTLIELPENKVVGIRTVEKDGYEAVQVGIDGGAKGIISEFRVESVKDYKIGDAVSPDQFKEGDKVVVKSKAKGKGYQGVVKRHGFAGSPASHGHRHDLRAPGSIGSAFPERVMKGKRMAGRMGSQSVTIKGLKIVMVDADRKIMALLGGVAGNNGALIKIIG